MKKFIFILFLIFIGKTTEEVADCIIHPNISSTELSVFNHKVHFPTKQDDIHDPFDYNFRYELYFQKPGVKCRISGDYLKIYIHSTKGGLSLTG